MAARWTIGNPGAQGGRTTPADEVTERSVGVAGEGLVDKVMEGHTHTHVSKVVGRVARR